MFARTSTGAVQVWWMEQDGSRYRSISGQKNGAMVYAEWTEAECKNVGRSNATKAEAQATKEIKSKYDKQLKSGGYWEDEADIDKQKFFQVTLAKSLKDYVHKIDWKKGVGVQIKYNGERVTIDRNGAWSRTGEVQHCIPHILESLKPFFAKYPDARLDGEGFNYEKRERLNEIHSLMSKKDPTPEELQQSKELIKFYCYDGFNFPNSEGMISQFDGYLLRKSAIDYQFFSAFHENQYKDTFGYVPTGIAHSMEEVDKIFFQCLKDKQEGVIVRILDVEYECKRTNNLLKYKPLDDAEFRIVSVQEGIGKFAGRIGTFTCANLDGKPFKDGELTFDATFKGKEVDACSAWVHGTFQSMIGKPATILFNGYTAYGKPNYPRLDWYNWKKH